MISKAYLEITNICNLACSFCHGTRRAPRTLTESEFETLTDALRLMRMEAYGYSVSATELVDPEDTPKNTLLRGIKVQERSQKLIDEYEDTLKKLIGDDYKSYLDVL